MTEKEDLIDNIKTWIGLDNEIKLLQKEIKNRREQKKLLTSELVNVMKNNDIDCWNTGEGKLIYSKTPKVVSHHLFCAIWGSTLGFNFE